jgi:PPP family 3-phenylpropionic acid transporter
VLGIQTPFFPLFLAERGLSPDAIGFALALPMVIRLAAMPLAGSLSDHLGAPRPFLVGLGVLAALGFTLIVFAPSMATILFAIGLSAIFWTPIFPLLEAYALRLASTGAVDYGRVRLWGSVSFIAANILGGYFLNWLPLDLVVWTIAGSILLFAVSSRLLPRFPKRAPHEKAPKLKMPPRTLLLGVIAAACVQASHAMVYGFSSIEWESNGIARSDIGILWSIGTGSEIVLFYLGTRVTRTISPFVLIAIGGLAALVRFGAFAFDPPPVLIAPLQILHAFTYGATHLGLMALLGRHVSMHSAGRAQTYSSTLLGAVMALATLAAGPLYARYGVAAYSAFAVLGGIGGVIALLAYTQPQRSASGGKTVAPS